MDKKTLEDRITDVIKTSVADNETLIARIDVSRMPRSMAENYMDSVLKQMKVLFPNAKVAVIPDIISLEVVKD